MCLLSAACQPGWRWGCGVLWVLLPALLLTGCSALKLGYNNAPELSYWWLDSFLDFSDPQSVQVRADLAAGR